MTGYIFIVPGKMCLMCTQENVKLLAGREKN